MDINSFQELKSGRSKLPAVVISRDHALADPNRPSLVDDAQIANSLFIHLERSLLAKEPAYNAFWQALTHTARGVISQQEVDDTTSARIEATKAMMENQVKALRTASGSELLADRDPSEMDDAALVKLVAVSTKAQRVAQHISESEIPGDRRASAMKAIERMAINESSGGPLPQRADLEAIPGLASVWNGPEGKGYRVAVKDLATSARETARDVNEQISRENENADEPEERIQPLKPRDILSGWIGSMTAQPPGAQQTWTNDYAVAMSTHNESVVAKGFIDIAMKAVREGRTPTGAELRAEIGALRAEMSRPEVRYIDDMEIQARGEQRIAKPFVRAAVTRPAIVGRTHDWRRGARVSEQSQEAAERSLKLLGKPIVGIEGQPHYDNADAIKAAMLNLTGRNRTTPIMVTHAGEATPFHDAVTKAAKDARVEILKGELRITTAKTVLQSEAKIDHVDGKYSAEMITGRTTLAQVWIKDAPIVDRRRDVDPKTGKVSFRNVTETRDVLLDSPEGRKVATGRIVMVEPGKTGPGDREKRAMATGLENHAALAPNALVAFVRTEDSKRGRGMDYGLARVIHRRTLSGRSAPFSVGKDGNRVSKDFISKEAAIIGATSAERAARDVASLPLDKLALNQPGPQSLVAMAVGPEKAALLASRFANVGEAIAVATTAQANPREASQLTKDGRHFTKDELFAAAALERATRDEVKFQGAVKRADALVTAATEAGSRLIADPSDKIVSKHGPLMALASESVTAQAKLPSVAIVGDERPVTENLAANIGKALDDLAKRHGRGEDGIAKFRVTTTLTAGVGEEVLKAAVERKVPVLALTHIDDRAVMAGTPELERIKLAMKANRAGLGGMATLDNYVAGSSQPSADKALKAAMDGAGAVVVARVRENDPQIVTFAVAGKEKPLMVMGASEADPVGYSGNIALRKPGVTLTREIAPADKAAIYTNAEISISSSGAAGRVFASTSTIDGALGLSSERDFDNLSATMGGRRLNLSLDRNESQFKEVAEAGPKVRMDVLDKVDLDRYGDADYSKDLQALKLRPEEQKLAYRMHIERVVFNTKDNPQIEPEYVRDMLATKFRVKGHQVETHAKDAGYGR